MVGKVRQETITPEDAEQIICELINDIHDDDLAKVFEVITGKKVTIKTTKGGEVRFVTTWREFD